jgi:hypothetical protein
VPGKSTRVWHLPLIQSGACISVALFPADKEYPHSAHAGCMFGDEAVVAFGSRHHCVVDSSPISVGGRGVGKFTSIDPE